MPSGTRSSKRADWRDLASLGEQLVSATSLADQRNRIISITGKLIAGKVDVWLNEELFRLPDWDEAPLFPAQPTLKACNAHSNSAPCMSGLKKEKTE